IVFVGGQALAPQGFARRSIKDTHSQAVFCCQLYCHFENICPATIIQAMPIQMGWFERSRKHCLNLRPEFDFQLGELDLSQKFGNASVQVEIARLINERGNLVSGGEW